MRPVLECGGNAAALAGQYVSVAVVRVKLQSKAPSLLRSVGALHRLASLWTLCLDGHGFALFRCVIGAIDHL